MDFLCPYNIAVNIQLFIQKKKCAFLISNSIKKETCFKLWFKSSFTILSNSDIKFFFELHCFVTNNEVNDQSSVMYTYWLSI
jgi:hypothetical protein